MNILFLVFLIKKVLFKEILHLFPTDIQVMSTSQQTLVNSSNREELTIDQLPPEKRDLLLDQSTFTDYADGIAATCNINIFALENELTENFSKKDLSVKLLEKLVSQKISMTHLALSFNTLCILILKDEKYGFTREQCNNNTKLGSEIVTDENATIDQIPMLSRYWLYTSVPFRENCRYIAEEYSIKLLSYLSAADNAQNVMKNLVEKKVSMHDLAMKFKDYKIGLIETKYGFTKNQVNKFNPPPASYYPAPAHYYTAPASYYTAPTPTPAPASYYTAPTSYYPTHASYYTSQNSNSTIYKPTISQLLNLAYNHKFKSKLKEICEKFTEITKNSFISKDHFSYNNLKNQLPIGHDEKDVSELLLKKITANETTVEQMKNVLKSVGLEDLITSDHGFFIL